MNLQQMNLQQKEPAEIDSLVSHAPVIADASPAAASPAGVRALMESLPGSKIRALADGRAAADEIIALWFGEPDVPTPDFITRSAIAALEAGRTHYTPNSGLPELREAIAAYMSRLHRRGVTPDRITVTASGMSALNLVQQLLIDPGDNVAAVVPLWPNLLQTVEIMGGEVRRAALRFDDRKGWQLDFEKLFGLVDHRTRALLINSPNNPTGWIMTETEQRAVLDFARARGLWVISDEVYNRLIYGRPVAPSFIDIAEADERVIAINSFSKSWAMTGWRLGWVTAPASLEKVLEKCVEYHHSCAAEFAQLAGVAALEQGEAYIGSAVARYRKARDFAVARLRAFPRIRARSPEATFYLFFRIDGMDDSLAWCRRALREAHVGLAPGSAFSTDAEGFIRLCFASDVARLDTAFDRLAPMLC